MKGGSAPTPPDPAVTAAAQTKSNQDTASYQAGLNMVDQNTPLGSLKYTQISPGDGTTAPHYESTVALTPEGQQSFDLQQQVSNALNNLALSGTSQVQAAFGQPASYSNLPSTSGLDLSKLPSVQGFDPSKITQAPSSLDLSSIGPAPTADAASRQLAQDALYGQATSRLDPQFALGQKQLETQLINKGIAQGSDAWNNALDQFGRTKNDAYSTAQNSSVTGAADYENTLFGMANQSYQDKLGTAQTQFGDQQTAMNNQIAEALAGANSTSAARSQALSEQEASNSTNLDNRQQGITEANYLRELPVNEISSLLNGGQVSMPSFSNTPQEQVAGTNVAGITQNSYQDAFGAWQQQQQSSNALLGSVFGAAGSILGGWATAGFA